MSSIFENKYVVFNTSDGPKVILESLELGLRVNLKEVVHWRN